MKRLFLIGAVLASGSFALQNISSGHGGIYHGPGDTVPPGGGGGGGGGTGPAVPGSSGPTNGGPTGGPTGNPGNPGNPTGGGAGPHISTGVGGGTDLTSWESWWGFNKDPYLNLKAAIQSGIIDESDGFFDGKKRNTHPLKPSEQTIREKVVPALKSALAKERANDIVTGALVALGKIGDVQSGEDGSSEFEPILSAFLSDPNQEIAETSAVALGILANEASVAKLRDLARDSAPGRRAVGGTEVKYRTRAFATYGLGLIGDRTSKNEVRQDIVHTLVQLLESTDKSTDDVKVAAMIALGLVPIDLDTSEDAKSSDVAASRQSEIRFVVKLFQSTQQEHVFVRGHAPTTLARLLRPAHGASASSELREEVVRVLLDAVDKHTKESSAVQESCVLALGQIGTAGKAKIDADIRTALMRLTTESAADLQVKSFALIALAQVGGRGAGEDFISGRQEVRRHLMSELTKSGSTMLRPWAGIAVGVMERALADVGEPQSDDAKSVLRTCLRDAKTPEQVGAFAIGAGIGLLTDPATRRILEAKLTEITDPNARGYVCLGLGLVDDREAIPEIQNVMKASRYKPELLRQAAIALGLMGDKDLVPYLCESLKEAHALSAQAALAAALGFIGDARSIDPLVKMLEQKEHITDTARGFAAVALGIVADKEPLPWNSKISTNLNYRASTSTLTGENGTGILDIL